MLSALIDSVLFNETVRYNLAFGGGVGITAEQMIDAARSSAIHDKIMSFPDQYETRVGERGQRLSGGEKQRGQSCLGPRLFCCQEK